MKHQKLSFFFYTGHKNYLFHIYPKFLFRIFRYFEMWFSDSGCIYTYDLKLISRSKNILFTDSYFLWKQTDTYFHLIKELFCRVGVGGNAADRTPCTNSIGMWTVSNLAAMKVALFPAISHCLLLQRQEGE